MQTTINQFLAGIFIAIFLSSCAANSNLPTVIEKGKIVNNMTITFTGTKKETKKEEFFFLKDYGLVANTTVKSGYVTLHGLSGNYTNNLTNINGCLQLMKNNEINNYDIIIKNLNTNKSYYGKIAFFNAHKA